MKLADKFASVFKGSEKAHGSLLNLKNSKTGEKSKGSCVTKAGPSSADLWQRHFDGLEGLGVIPITSRNSCSWGAVDIDVYDGLDLEQLSTELPHNVFLCRTKSGGAHLYIFIEPAVQSALLIKKLRLIARAVGHPNAEIFPKQEFIEGEAVGNWINMPYFGGDNTNRFCVYNGEQLDANQFIATVQQNIMTLAEISAFTIEPLQSTHQNDDDFSDAPPCIAKLVKIGFPFGSRNHALFSLGIFASKKFPEHFKDKVAEYNTRFLSGSYDEVANVIRSVRKGGYGYKCKEQPLFSHCDKHACSETIYGVKLTATEDRAKRPNLLHTVIKVVCYEQQQDTRDEPYWIFTFENDKELLITFDMFSSQTLFKKEYARVFKKIFLPVPDKEWVRAINELSESAEIFQQAPDAGVEGQFRIHLDNFITGKIKAKIKDEISVGRVWNNEGRNYFRSSDLIKYLDMVRFKNFKGEELWRILSRYSAEHHTFNVMGKPIDCWSIPDYHSTGDHEFDKHSVPNESVEY